MCFDKLMGFCKADVSEGAMMRHGSNTHPASFRIRFSTKHCLSRLATYHQGGCRARTALEREKCVGRCNVRPGHTIRLGLQTVLERASMFSTSLLCPLGWHL